LDDSKTSHCSKFSRRNEVKNQMRKKLETRIRKKERVQKGSKESKK
jgi:hypothetical protein